MNFNGLRSIVDATEEQFTSHYQHLQSKECTQSQFVEEYKSKQALAKEDVAKLNQVGVEPQQIADKLYKIVEKANTAYKLTLTNQPPNIFSMSFKRPIIDVEEDGSFKVSNFDLREMRLEECSLCDHKISGLATYVIENVTTHEKISFPELTLHLIRTHVYFGKSGNYRLDPLRACKALELVK